MPTQRLERLVLRSPNWNHHSYVLVSDANEEMFNHPVIDDLEPVTFNDGTMSDPFGQDEIYSVFNFSGSTIFVKKRIHVESDRHHDIQGYHFYGTEAIIASESTESVRNAYNLLKRLGYIEKLGGQS